MISVILSSHNGSRTLPLTLASLQTVKWPSSDIEFIAIDNASTDSTRCILESYRPYLPVRILAEPRLGKSVAINLGIQHAKGDLIVFTDDDIIADPDWLSAYATAAAQNPGVSIFAGQVRHYWEKQPPEWLERLALEGRSYAGTPVDLFDGPVSLRYAKGLNFMVRRPIIEELRFSEEPGINFTGQNTSQGGEETDFVKRALAMGHELYHVSEALVEHIVRREQVGLWPVFNRYVRIGRAGVLQGQFSVHYKGPRILGFPRYLFKLVPMKFACIGYKWIRGRHYDAADEIIDLGLTCGRAIEIERLRRSPKKLSPSDYRNNV